MRDNVCTYCGHTGHRAHACLRRKHPSWLSLFDLVLAALVVSIIAGVFHA